jgi:DNA-binding NarL/FixJ family response regulator
VIVDDEPLVRDGFRMIVDAHPDMAVVGVGGDGAEAVALVDEHRPDVVLIDVRMPVMDGITATRLVVGRHPATRVVVLTTFDDDEYVNAALRAGASGFLLKRLTSSDLVHAIRVVAGGDALLAPSVTRRLIERYAAQPTDGGSPHVVDLAAVHGLTEREIDVLHEVVAGRTNPEIAVALGLGESTVKTHVSNVLAKIHCRDRVQAVIFAYDAGLIAPRPR